MLFDDAVLYVVRAHFVPVIADHPRGSTEPKRNPTTWDRCESWKRSPNSAELVWLVSADTSRRAGFDYSGVKEPAVLLAWMEAVRVFDGGIAKPTEAQLRAAVLVHLREALGATWQWHGNEPPPRTFFAPRKAFDAVAGGVTDDELCPPDAAAALLERLRAPSDERRAALRATLGELIDVAVRLDPPDATWLAPFATRQAADELGGEAGQLAAVRLFRSWLGRELRQGNVEPDEGTAAELVRLGVVRTSDDR